MQYCQLKIMPIHSNIVLMLSLRIEYPSMVTIFFAFLIDIVVLLICLYKAYFHISSVHCSTYLHSLLRKDLKDKKHYLRLTKERGPLK